jgi:pimeloyl-ACP methyl ester carboxylesterase
VKNVTGVRERHVSCVRVCGGVVGWAVLLLDCAEQGPSASALQDIQIVRPPVVLVHGLWGSRRDWDAIGPYLESLGLGISTQRATYDDVVDVSSSTPAYDFSLGGSPTGSSLGLAFAAQTILPHINQDIQAYESSNPASERIAVVRADVVAHSMGGIVTRTPPGIAGYSTGRNYFQGLIHKLVTIGTPHLGSPLATQLLLNGNGCVQYVLGAKGKYALVAAVTDRGTFSGGVEDQQADLAGTSGSLSPALSAIQPGRATFGTRLPTGLIAASMTDDQLATVDTDPTAALIRFTCSQSPLAQNMTSVGWPTVLGSGSDAIVPLNSQLAGSLSTPFPQRSCRALSRRRAIGFCGRRHTRTQRAGLR